MISTEILARDYICKLEDYRDIAYLCSAKVPTIGFGTTVYPDGSRVKLGDKCTLPQAYAWINDYLEKSVFPKLKKYPDLPTKIFVALCSLIYNVGDLGPTILKTLQTRKFELLPVNFMQYVFVKGKVCDGLVNRRKAEVKYFTEGKKNG